MIHNKTASEKHRRYNAADYSIFRNISNNIDVEYILV